MKESDIDIGDWLKINIDFLLFIFLIFHYLDKVILFILPDGFNN